MKLSIIIVSWNVQKRLRENLNAIYQSDFDFGNLEVFVVDNNSADKTCVMLRREFPQVKLIANSENLGFAKANNQAIRSAKGDYILLLNPDMRVRKDTLACMAAWMDKNQQAKVAGCKLVHEDGEIVKHVRRFPRLSDQLAIILKLPHIFPGVLDNYIIRDFDYTRDAKVDSIRGGFFMMRNDVSEPRFLDERYFLWFEEVDFCLDVKRHRGEVWYTPSTECIDHVGQSFKQVGTLKKQKYFRDSMLKYFQKWHPGWKYRILKAAWFLGLTVSWFFARLGFTK